VALDLDLALISAILAGDGAGLKVAREAAMRPDLLMGEHAPGAYKLINDHAKLYGSPPSRQVVEAKLSLALPDVDEPAEFFVKEVWARKMQIDLRNSLLETAKHLDDARPYEALDALESLLRGIRREHQVSHSRAESIPKLWPKVMEHYDRMKAGERGILTPWPTINEETYGFWPEDLILFAAKTGTGKCVYYQTLTHDPATGAPHTVEDVYKRGDLVNVLSWSKEDGVHVQRITAKHDTGTKRCLRFELGTGRSITVTPEHPFLTPDGWQRADELVAGSTVGLPSWIPEPLEPVGMQTHEVDVLAIMLADGSLAAHGSPTFTKDDPSIVALGRTAAEAFGITLEPSARGRDWRFTRAAGAQSNPVDRLLRRLRVSGLLSKEKVIPEEVYRLPQEQLARFLAVFWMCDGYVDSGAPGITLASEKLVRGIQHLLLRFGVQSSVRYKQATCDGKKFDAWRLRVYSQCLPAFAKHVQLWGEKGRRLEESLKRPRNANVGFPRVSEELMLRIKGEAGARGYHNPNGDKLQRICERLGRGTFSPRQLFKKHGDLYSVSLDALRVYCDEFGCTEEYSWLWDSEVFWDTVEAVEDVGEQKIYDFTVEPTSCFVANDVIVHNTWCTALIAHHAWENGHKVLFGSTEISKLRIAMRFAALHFKVSYRELRLGRLDAFTEKRVRAGIAAYVQEVERSERLKVIGGDFDFRVDTYEDAIREYEPDLAVMDGAYLLKTEGKNRTERAANAFDELKRICKRTSVPNLVTMQFNREVKSNTASTFRADRIALTDVSSWNADLAYALIQTDDMKKDRRMLMKALKMREGEGEAFEVNWDIDRCNFSELPRVGGPVQPGGGDDDEDPFSATHGGDSGDAPDEGVPF